MTRQEEIATAKEFQRRHTDRFRDRAGEPIRLGSYVHYTEDRTDPTGEFTTSWTPDRWGIVTGFLRTHNITEKHVDANVEVTPVRIYDEEPDGIVYLGGAWSESWYADPTRLQVIK